jgi:hypothetical protein
LVIGHANYFGKEKLSTIRILWHSNMPFRSKRQQRLFFATMPELAKEWADKTDFSKLPEKARKKKKHSECDDTEDRQEIDCGEKTLQFAAQYERLVSLLKDG